VENRIYVIHHFLEYNISGKFDREYKLYGHHQNFLQDEDSFLIRGGLSTLQESKDILLRENVHLLLLQ